VSRDDFRRELGSAFDDIAGSPSPALSDRVRSAVSEAPERKGTYWAAGLAAVLIAAVLVGVLVVANPLNRLHSAVPPVVPSPSASPANSPVPTPTPQPTPSASPVASPVATPSGYACGTTQLVGTQAPLSAYVDAVRTGSHAGYDRLTIEFNNGQPGTINVTPQNSATFNSGGGQGGTVTLAGQAGILVDMHSADAHTSYSGSTDFKTAYPVMVEVRQIEDFEGYVQWAIGLTKAACYHAYILTNPTRLVIDILNT
jgi:hypothetical protein